MKPGGAPPKCIGGMNPGCIGGIEPPIGGGNMRVYGINFMGINCIDCLKTSGTAFLGLASGIS